MGDDLLADASDLHSTRVLAKQEPDKEEANDVPRDRLAHLDHQTLLPGGRMVRPCACSDPATDPSPSWQRRTEQLLQPSEPGEAIPSP
jgi:hypothetical protein